ncbi:MAG: ComEC/Rec2 family competence protein [Patescibacteria group bacterium UBA2103]
MVRVSILFFLIVAQTFLSYEIFSPKYLEVTFLDVGQGDAIYIKAPNGNDVLIDGGANASVLRELSKRHSYFDRDIDVVIGTHPDKDHIGGLVDVFDRYNVSYFLDPGVTNTTNVYTELMERVSDEGTYVVARKGMKVVLGTDVYIEILFPDREIKGGVNNASVVTRLVYKDTSVLLTGDAGVSIEKFLIGENIKSTILKAGHHGSKTSSDFEFVKAVDPEFIVISAGKDNRYGHPHEEVLRVFESIKAKTLATYEQGSLVFFSDGEKFFLK